MKVYLILVYEFFKTGLFAIGGGVATLPFLYEMAGKYDWFDTHMLANMVAVSDSTPGPIGINMATYAGEMAGGVLGGILATLALVAPSIIIIELVAKMLDKFQHSKAVQWGMAGIRPAATGMIGAAEYQLFKIVICDTETFVQTGALAALFPLREMVILVGLIIAVFTLKKHPIVYIVAGAVLGIVFQL